MASDVLVKHTLYSVSIIGQTIQETWQRCIYCGKQTIGSNKLIIIYFLAFIFILVFQASITKRYINIAFPVVNYTNGVDGIV